MNIRKILLASFAMALIASPAAFADDHGGGHGDGPMEMKKFNADTDGDGALSKAEFLAVQEKRFAEMDTDSDGQISKEERQAHMDKMKEHMKERKEKWKEKRQEMKEKTESGETAE